MAENLGGFNLNIFEKFAKDFRGVSSVLGEVLITGIFVIVLGSLFVVVNSVDKPVDSTRLSAEEWIDAPSDIISLRHAGGEPIDTENLKVYVKINGTNHVYSPSDISENLGGKGTWELADTIQINTSQKWGTGIGDEEDIDVKLIDTSSKEVLPKYRIGFVKEPSMVSDPVDFEIIDDAVVPQENFVSSFKVLGAAHQYQYNGHTYNRMVTCRLKVGNVTFDPWGDYNLPVTSNLNGRSTNSWSLTAYPAGTPVTVIGRAWLVKYNSYWSPSYRYNLDNSWKNTMEVSSTSNSSNLIVLKNGNTVPAIAGAMNQDSIEDYLEGYIGENNKIILEENEAIFLFELGTTDLTSSAADFQDLVVLMTIDSVPAS